MLVENCYVYGLQESVIASGYPMLSDPSSIDLKYETDNLKYWLKNKKFFNDFMNYYNLQNKNIGKNSKDSCLVCGSDKHVQKYGKDGNYYCSKHTHQMDRYKKTFETEPIYNLLPEYVSVKIFGEFGVESEEVLLDYIDLEKFFYQQWNVSDYCKSNEVGLFHRYVFDEIEDGMVVDHINKNKLDNRRINLRICSHVNNSRNSIIGKSNSSGVIGVCFNKDKNKWKSYLNVNGKQIHLGYFESFDDAIISRLNGEREYFKEYSPQIHLF